MAEKKKAATGRPYKLPMVGGRPKKRLSRAEFENMVRTMGTKALREYMLNVGTPRNSRELNVFDQIEATEGMKAVELGRATGMKKGGIVKAQPKRIVKKTAQPKKIAKKTAKHRK